MPAKTISAAKKTGLVGVHLNLPAEILAAVDARRDEINAEAGYAKITRTEVIRDALAEMRQRWDERRPPPMAPYTPRGRKKSDG